MAMQKYIPLLKISKDGVEEVLKQQGQIKSEIYSFYSELFANKDQNINIDSIDQSLGAESSATCPKLDNNNIEDRPLISYDELSNYLTLPLTAYWNLVILRGGASEAPPKISRKELSLTPCCYIAFVCLYI